MPQRFGTAGFSAALLTLVVCSSPLQASSDESIDRWNRIAVEISVKAAPDSPLTSAAAVGLVQAAVFDAVNALDGARFESFASSPSVARPASLDAAVSRAAHDVLVWLYPSDQAWLDKVLMSYHAGAVTTGREHEGDRLGAATAAAVTQACDADVRGLSIAERALAGAWWVSCVTRLANRSPSQFRSALPASSYDDEAFEGRTRLSGAANIAADHPRVIVERTRFWSEDPTTMWNRYYRRIASARRLAPVDRARLLAETNVAVADGLGQCNASCVGRVWGGQQASAKICGSRAAAETLATFFGTDVVDSVIDSTVTGRARTFNRFSDIHHDAHGTAVAAVQVAVAR